MLYDAHPRPALAVDCVVFGLGDVDLEVLFIERVSEPFAGRWALPGGLVGLDETLEEAARRQLREATGLDKAFLEQLYTFGAVDRDPRERVVTVAWYALANIAGHAARGASDGRRVEWFPARNPPPLAFDHAEILAMARTRLQGKVRYQPIGFELLPEKFTLSQLQRLYETTLDRKLDKRNFRRKALAMGFLEPTDETQREVSHRAARLYRFDESRYRRLAEEGFLFEL